MNGATLRTNSIDSILYFFFFDVMVIDAWGGYFGVVVSSCWLTRNIVPHISLHDEQHHKSMKKY